jgi:hypothetical protein
MKELSFWSKISHERSSRDPARDDKKLLILFSQEKLQHSFDLSKSVRRRQVNDNEKTCTRKLREGKTNPVAGKAKSAQILLNFGA